MSKRSSFILGCVLASVVVAALLGSALAAGPGTEAAPASAPSAVGNWDGELKTPTGGLRLVIHVKQQRDTLSATFDSPDQFAYGLRFDTAEQRGDSLKLEMKMIAASYAAVFDSGGAVLRGQWRQGGGAFPLDLRRASAEAKPRSRPQDPVPPYPYDTLEVSYSNPGRATLGGTLTMPRGRGPSPAVILVTGSGPEDRNEEIFEHRPFLVLADYLTRRGIVVLRVDDRGIGKSTGDVTSATSEDFTGDVLAGIEFLKKRREVDPRLIGVIGHSEGGLIAPMAANLSSDVAFIVLMAGPGIGGEELSMLQNAKMMRSMGATDSMVAFGLTVNRLAIQIARQESDTTRAVARLRALSDSLKAAMPEGLRSAQGDRPVLGRAQIRLLTTPWLRFFLLYDPVAALERVRCPVLAVNGENDLQVPPKENLAGIEKALRAGGNRDFKVLELPKLNHLFQTSVTGSVAEYHSISETFAPAALAVIGDWIVAHTARAPAGAGGARRDREGTAPRRAPSR